jgi:hypothetical protein
MVATIFKKTQGGATRRKGAQGQGKTGPKAGLLVPGEWQDGPRDGSLPPGTGCSSRTAEKLMLQ